MIYYPVFLDLRGRLQWRESIVGYGNLAAGYDALGATHAAPSCLNFGQKLMDSAHKISYGVSGVDSNQKTSLQSIVRQR